MSRLIFRRSRAVVLSAFLALLLAGCITTMESSKPKIDKQQALEANIKLGMTYLQQNKREGAVRSFTKALDLDSKSAEAHLGMALLHQLNGEIKESEVSFKRALSNRSRIDFSRASIEFSYARLLFEQERFNESMKLFQLSSSDYAYNGRPDALMNVGLCALKLDDQVRAKAAFEHSLNLNPRIAQSNLELADMAFMERDYSNAKQYLDRFSSITRHVPRSLWLGIRIERIFGNKDKEASYALALKNLYPYSKEFLDYKRFIETQ
ncbi:type IV pilus biogenesis/stability protein PilW [Teredinibacter haidensis]|uniref:type IV pilus biogenesis/stability protein PilW n=1 Tax=Teredinibacter haidensis TaxID=2731755 RepID=UPI000B30D65F|nr:type IV pilus biogenesis/stability protein PilW [Teredinibacter haidensis]